MFYCPISRVTLNECRKNIYKKYSKLFREIHITVCPESSDPFYVVTYYIKWVTTSWTKSMYVWCRHCIGPSVNHSPFSIASIDGAKTS